MKSISAVALAALLLTQIALPVAAGAQASSTRTPELAPGEGASLVVRVQWAERPDSSDVEKLRPVGLRDAAQAVLRCRLSEPGHPADGRLHMCSVLNEAPTGRGLGAAALTLAGRFRMDSRTYAAIPDDALVTVPIRWRSLIAPIPSRPAAFSSSVTGMDLIARPTFLRTPTPEQVRNTKPEGKGGRVVIECTVTVDADVKDCRLMEESPLGAGLGEAALKLSSAFRVSPILDQNGKPKEAVVRIPFNFNPD